jgi:hypothetical protein
VFELSLLFLLSSPEGDLLLHRADPSLRPQKLIISTEATDSLIVRCGVERPPYFSVALAVACS